jgi:hypothetical protein
MSPYLSLFSKHRIVQLRTIGVFGSAPSFDPGRSIMALTLEQIARLAGVSLSTASRVINDQPNVRPEVRERVWQVIHEQGYQPNLAARSLALKRADPDADPVQA